MAEDFHENEDLNSMPDDDEEDKYIQLYDDRWLPRLCPWCPPCRHAFDENEKTRWPVPQVEKGVCSGCNAKARIRCFMVVAHAGGRPSDNVARLEKLCGRCVNWCLTEVKADKINMMSPMKGLWTFRLPSTKKDKDGNIVLV